MEHSWTYIFRGLVCFGGLICLIIHPRITLVFQECTKKYKLSLSIPWSSDEAPSTLTHANLSLLMPVKGLILFLFPLI